MGMAKRKAKGRRPGGDGKDSKMTLSVRMDQKLVDALADDAEIHRTTQAKIVQRLLEYFHEQTAEVQYLILSAVNTSEVPRINQTLQLIEWGNHSYQRGMWFWSIEAYTKLDKVADGMGSMQRLVRAKLSLCWMFLAIQLRHQALLQQDAKGRGPLYDAAIDSLCVAIGYIQIYNDYDLLTYHESYATAFYNDACSLALIAQYSLEREASEEQLAPLRKAELEKEPKPVLLLQNERQDSSGVERTNKLMKKALERLSKIPGRDEEADGQTKKSSLFAETQWLFTHSESDPDLALLRERYEPGFKEWIASKRSGSRWLNAFEKCHEFAVDSKAVKIPTVDELLAEHSTK